MAILSFKSSSREPAKADVSISSATSLQNHILAGLPDPECQLLLKHSQLVQLDFDQSIYHPADRTDYVYFPIDSVFSSFATMKDGATVEVYMTGKDGLVGLAPLINDDETVSWTSVQVAGKALRIATRIAAEGFRRNDYIRAEFLKGFRAMQKQIAQRAVCNVRHTITKRLACWILMIHDRAGKSDLNLTHDAIAGRLGARRPGITVAANIVHQVGGIDYKRGVISIRDRKVIENIVCECYESLRLEAAPRKFHAIE